MFSIEHIKCSNSGFYSRPEGFTSERSALFVSNPEAASVLPEYLSEERGQFRIIKKAELYGIVSVIVKGTIDRTIVSILSRCFTLKKPDLTGKS